MGTLLDVVTAFLDGQSWPYETVKDGRVVRFPFAGDSEEWQVFVEAREQYFQVVVYSVAPFNIPEEHRLPAAEYLTRANYGLIIGNFELDMEDGEVRFKTSIDVEGAALASAMVRQLVFSNLRAMNQYLPGLAAVVEGKSSAKQIVSRVEGG